MAGRFGSSALLHLLLPSGFGGGTLLSLLRGNCLLLLRPLLRLLSARCVVRAALLHLLLPGGLGGRTLLRLAGFQLLPLGGALGCLLLRRGLLCRALLRQLGR